MTIVNFTGGAYPVDQTRGLIEVLSGVIAEGVDLGPRDVHIRRLGWLLATHL